MLTLALVIMGLLQPSRPWQRRVQISQDSGGNVKARFSALESLFLIAVPFLCRPFGLTRTLLGAEHPILRIPRKGYTENISQQRKSAPRLLKQSLPIDQLPRGRADAPSTGNELVASYPKRHLGLWNSSSYLVLRRISPCTERSERTRGLSLISLYQVPPNSSDD